MTFFSLELWLMIKMGSLILMRRELSEEFKSEFFSHHQYFLRLYKMTLHREKMTQKTVLFFLIRAFIIPLQAFRLLPIEKQMRSVSLIAVRLMQILPCDFIQEQREISKAMTWLMKAARWPRSEYYPRSKNRVELKDTIPYLRPRWRRGVSVRGS